MFQLQQSVTRTWSYLRSPEAQPQLWLPGPVSSRAIFLNPSHTYELPEELFKNIGAWAHPRPVNSESLQLGLGHWPCCGGCPVLLMWIWSGELLVSVGSQLHGVETVGVSFIHYYTSVSAQCLTSSRNSSTVCLNERMNQ